jgi:hypothetical protein
MEGDERVHFDESRGLRLSIGTEDIFGGAYYFTNLFTLPDHGTSQYRLMLADPWPFRTGIHLGIEHGGGNFEQASIHSVVYWYGTRRPALRRTDAFDVADRGAADAAGYTHTGSTPSSLTAFFEGDSDGNVSAPTDLVYLGSLPPPSGTDPMGESVTAAGYSHPVLATISYSATLDPRNDGAVLRRLTDGATFGQRAEVTIDGQPAGIWLTPGANTSKRWLESAYAIPAQLTAGRRRITVGLRVLPPVDAPPDASVGWADYRYATFSRTHRR